MKRRTVLRGAGVSLALPWLTAMQPAFANDNPNQSPRRFVAMTLSLGLIGENLNPGQAGRDYEPSLYLKQLQDIRDRFTVVSGVSHPGVSGGHRAEASLLTANPVGSSGKAKNTISLDQHMAKHLGDDTRFSSLVLSSSGSNSPSYTENGAMIPAEQSPSRLFNQLFVTRVRELENRMAKSEEWARKSKPKVNATRPVDIRNSNDFVGQERLMTDMIRLALETDSTRFISYHMGGGGGVVPIEGVEEGYHTLSHHGRDEEKLEQLALVETAIVGTWGQFVRDLMVPDERGESVLDNTSILLTSNLGNASNHDNRNMPVLVAGGQFKHGQHLMFDAKNNYPLPNLFVDMLQHVGLEEDKFASSTGTMTGLKE